MQHPTTAWSLIAKGLATWALLLGFHSLHANDGSFYARGGTLIPVQETVVRMDKEVLRLKREGDHIAVTVDFEFYNPGPAKTLLVGFVTPPAGGDVPEEAMEHPQVRDFSVAANGATLPFKVARLDGTGFKVLDGDDYQGDDFVYHFDLTFQPGVTKVHHAYAYRGGSSVDEAISFFYRLTTGGMWAGGKIADFSLEVDMGDRVLFALPWSLQADSTHAPWVLNGKGKLPKDPRSPYGEWKSQAVYVSQGTVGLHLRDFKPEGDLFVNVYHPYMEVALWEEAGWRGTFGELGMVLPPYAPDSVQLAEVTDTELWLLRNLPYAQHGLVLKDARLRATFERMLWYDPLTGRKSVDDRLTADEQAYIAAIAAEERRRKGAGK